jgi:hypothetical protein
MKKSRKPSGKTDMLKEYDFRGGQRGKYVRRYRKGTNIVVLEPDVADLFPDSDSVNRALRACGEIIRSGRRK